MLRRPLRREGGGVQGRRGRLRQAEGPRQVDAEAGEHSSIVQETPSLVSCLIASIPDFVGPKTHFKCVLFVNF